MNWKTGHAAKVSRFLGLTRDANFPTLTAEVKHERNPTFTQ
jgi:hypothetical protein